MAGFFSLDGFSWPVETGPAVRWGTTEFSTSVLVSRYRLSPDPRPTQFCRNDREGKYPRFLPLEWPENSGNRA